MRRLIDDPPCGAQLPASCCLQELYGLHRVPHRLSLHPQSEKIRIYHLKCFLLLWKRENEKLS